MEQDAVIRDLQTELMRVTEQRDKWLSIATMFYDRHENRRNCSLIQSCKQCDEYEKAVRGG